ncbi:MAG: HAMP domain-containing histidine kinase [Eubacterium sp.]|nr:HAMP domain-containing histidine kinase [Eubacterium sp.]
MERIKQMQLKKALFVIVFFNSIAAFVLSGLSFWGCIRLSGVVAPQGVSLHVQSETMERIEVQETAVAAVQVAEAISVLQFVLPVFIYSGAMLLSAAMFYRLKLKEPLEMLANGASRIIDNDLDFTMEAKAKDELGQLCTVFETMRQTLLDNNRELWRQAEERKRLNAAFSHNLRNPVTVLKGSAKLAKKGIAKAMDTQQLVPHLDLIESYTGRIERYIETMSSIQKLEEIPIERETVPWGSLVSELKKMMQFVGAGSGKQIHFHVRSSPDSVWIDPSALYQVAENLISNALRFAAQNIEATCSVSGQSFELSVTDDGCGFPDAFMKNGIQPFQKGKEEAEHFGMGLYACKVLCQRHGGSIAIENHKIGATVTATLKMQQP